MIYDLYHDESQEDGYWHGMLMVPRSGRQLLLDALAHVRDNTNWHEPVTLKTLRTRGRRFRCLRGWLTAAVGALVQIPSKRTHYYNGAGKLHPEFAVLEHIGARFILFRVRDGHQGLSTLLTHAQKVETTFRMGLRGGLHLFAAHSAQVHVASIHFDGYEHYGRHVDSNRIVGRVGVLRAGVSVADPMEIDDRSGDHMRSNCQSYEDCQLLQLTDLLVSGFRSVLARATHAAQAEIAAPLRDLAERWHAGPRRMSNSRWRGGICISECYLEQDEWKFSDIRPSAATSQLTFEGL